MNDPEILSALNEVRREVGALAERLDELTRALHGDNALPEHRGLRERVRELEKAVGILETHRQRILWVGGGILLGQAGLNVATFLKLLGV